MMGLKLYRQKVCHESFSIHCANQPQKNTVYIEKLNSVKQGRTWLIQEFCLPGSPNRWMQNKTHSPSEDDCLKLWSTLSQLASDLCLDVQVTSSTVITLIQGIRMP